MAGYTLDPPTQPSLFEVVGVARGMRSIIGAGRDGHSVKCAMSDVRPEVVIHMAAQPLVGWSYDNPEETYST